MSPSEWRTLIEAFLERRIGADAFARRFLEAFRAGSHPAAIDTLAIVVEAYEPDPDRRLDGAPDEAELESAAHRALLHLREEEGGLSPTYDRARAREEIRRFRIDVRRVAGFGCAIAFAWVGLCLLQIFAVSDQIQHALRWPAAPATFAGLALAFVPVVGNSIAFFGATDVWHWPAWIAAIVFFAAPAATLLSGWLRWMRRPPYQ